MNTSKIFPIFYLGSIEYYHQLLNNKVIFEQHENFIKQTYRNRCSIYGANGKLNLIIPLERTGDRRVIKDLKIANNQRWQELHWKSIQAAYRSSPYFEFYEDDFYPFYQTQFELLTEFNLSLHNKICELLNIDFSKSLSSSYQNIEPIDDYRLKFNAKKPAQIINFYDKEYIQVFSNKKGFINNLSIIDLLFNEGPNSIQYLKSLT